MRPKHPLLILLIGWNVRRREKEDEWTATAIEIENNMLKTTSVLRRPRCAVQVHVLQSVTRSSDSRYRHTIFIYDISVHKEYYCMHFCIQKSRFYLGIQVQWFGRFMENLLIIYSGWVPRYIYIILNNFSRRYFILNEKSLFICMSELFLMNSTTSILHIYFNLTFFIV